jgi:hypothetical protein
MKAVSALIDQSETHTRLGVTREELQTVIAQWPDIDDRDQKSNGFLAIHNSLNEICHGLGVDEWVNLVDASLNEVKETYRNWLRIQNTRGGIR